VNERPGSAVRPSSRSKDDITVVKVHAFAPVPSFLSEDASRHAADGDGRASAAPTPTLEAEVKRLQMALNKAARNRPAGRSVHGGGSLPFPGRAVSGATGSGILTAMLSRPRFAVAGMALASVMIAAVAGAFVFVMLPQTEDWDLAELPPSPPPSLPDAATAATVVNGSEAGLQARPAQPDSPPAENTIEVAELQIAPDRPAMPESAAIAAPEHDARPETPVTMAADPGPPARSEPPPAAAPEPEKPERAVIMAYGIAPAAPPEPAPGPALAAPPLAPPLLEPPPLAAPARPEPPVMAAPAPAPFESHESFTTAAREPVPPPRSEPPPEMIAVKRTQPRAGRLLPGPAARAGFQFADSSVRYLTSAELQRLSANRLRIARNEIFARKGRYFKDDALRAYFSQFAWYQPRAWDVPLSPVEVANVGLIQSVEDAATAQTRSIGEPAPAEPEQGTRAAFPDPHRQYLTPADLQDLSTDQLVLVRNEIFARKGRYFKDPALRAFFEKFPWYQPYAWDVPLSPVERANVDTIQSVEQARGARLPPT
jgi:hypothetical protein